MKAMKIVATIVVRRRDGKHLSDAMRQHVLDAIEEVVPPDVDDYETVRYDEIAFDVELESLEVAG